MSLGFDDDKNWRAPTAAECSLVESVAPERISRARRIPIGMAFGFVVPALILVFVGLLEKTTWLADLIVIIPIGAVCVFIYFKKYADLKKCIASGQYSVQTGTVVRKSVHIKGGKSNYIIFKSDSGSERKVFLPSKYYLEFSEGDRCLLMKIEPKGPGYDDPIECIKP